MHALGHFAAGPADVPKFFGHQFRLGKANLVGVFGAGFTVTELADRFLCDFEPLRGKPVGDSLVGDNVLMFHLL